MKNKTGTREWSDVSFNLGHGCVNNCRYCYAKEWALRYGLIVKPQEWSIEVLKSKKPKIVKGKTVMFPTVHDISLFYLEPAVVALRQLLEAGNKILIVSKPRRECIERICAEFSEYKERLLFRFSIGTLDEKLAAFWEPGAPTIEDRVACLKLALNAGFKTSVSMEPMLDGPEDAERTFFALEPFVNERIWLGKMNKLEQRVRPKDPTIQAACDRVKAAQSHDNILRLVKKLHGHPKVKWKDSIRSVIKSSGLFGDGNNAST